MHPEVQEWSIGPPKCQRGVGRHTCKSGRIRQAIQEVR